MTAELTYPVSRQDLPSVELDGELVVYDELGRGIHHLNRTATLVFRCFDGESTVEEIAVDIAETAGLPLEQVEHEVHQLLLDFCDQGLIEGVAGTGGSTNGRG
jgi:hypothetical protein